jgi:SAM-dependent methyltransferase
MISEANLHFIRAYEIAQLATRLKPGSYILEVGAGTGYQAKALSDRGFRVVAIDLPQSKYSDRRVFPVADYDGKTLPFPDRTFDIVFTSNVLEHVSSLERLLAETRRVLKPHGYCIHAMPTVTWRVWSSLSGYIDLPPYLLAVMSGHLRPGWRGFGKMVLGHLIPRSHGKVHPLFVELWTFSRMYWIKKFEKNGFQVVRAEPMRLFYTGWSVLGSSLSLRRRERLANFLGSSCTLYEVKPL